MPFPFITVVETTGSIVHIAMALPDEERWSCVNKSMQGVPRCLKIWDVDSAEIGQKLTVELGHEGVHYDVRAHSSLLLLSDALVIVELIKMAKVSRSCAEPRLRMNEVLSIFTSNPMTVIEFVSASGRPAQQKGASDRWGALDNARRSTQDRARDTAEEIDRVRQYDHGHQHERGLDRNRNSNLGLEPETGAVPRHVLRGDDREDRNNGQARGDLPDR
ncbi:hypothetical protein MKZ38_008712 [Zalerion maritima]|uniref:Uncharacterized protein n=1 Tax=Zalerion maritima TaxID=339359 RepID=A0AAD5S299_9PEZI|nr:hypothetical protein MKZ38_008712 [Zalerion maritima]